jgi:hypothetical protein
MPEHQVGPVRSMVERISYRYVPSLGELLEAADALDAQLAYEKREAELWACRWGRSSYGTGIKIDTLYPALLNPSPKPRFTVVIGGIEWEYDPSSRYFKAGGDKHVFPWLASGLTPADFRAIADCVELAQRAAAVRP